MLKATAESIAEPLAKLFTLSLSKGKFPKLWKTAGIVPIPKSTNKNKSDPTEYRPISLLSIVSKLLEIIFHSILWEHLVEYIYAPISDMQWGFQKSRSTTSLLLHTIHDWFTLLDQQMEIMCVFYFKRAFDTVPHWKLMNVLCEIDTHPVLLSWLCSYLSGRQQYMMVNGEHSERCHVLSRVPQGSVLGPLLFLIYINSLTFIPLSDSTRLILYADDLLIYKPILTETSHLQLQSDINSISL